MRVQGWDVRDESVLTRRNTAFTTEWPVDSLLQSAAIEPPAGGWIAPVSSRLGMAHERHHAVARGLSQLMLRARSDDQGLLVGGGTAIESWATRAADLMGVPHVTLIAANAKPAIRTSARSRELSLEAPCGQADIDHWIVQNCPRIEAMHVRPKGKLHSALQSRLSTQPDGVRVTTDQTLIEPPVKMELMEAGAVLIHRQCTATSTVASDEHVKLALDKSQRVDWQEVVAEHRWLTHCTRSRSGPWPGQSWEGYQDDLLAGDPEQASRSALDALARIVRMRRIVGSAITTDKRFPVVCFSEVPVAELIQRRSYRSHLKRWDYEPYAILVSIDAAKRHGLKPVIYGVDPLTLRIATGEEYLFQAEGANDRWREEREWRWSGDLDLACFRNDEVIVAVPNTQDAVRIANRPGFPWRVAVVAEGRSND